MKCRYCGKVLTDRSSIIMKDGELAHSTCHDEANSKDEREQYYKMFPKIDKHIVNRLWYESEDEVKTLSEEWCIVWNTDADEFIVYGYSTKESFISSLVKEYKESDNTDWSVHSIYHNQEPIGYEVDVKIKLKGVIK